MTDARSWSSYVQEAACPKCGAQPGDVCRTKTKRTTDTHGARIDAWLLDSARRVRDARLARGELGEL